MRGLQRPRHWFVSLVCYFFFGLPLEAFLFPTAHLLTDVLLYTAGLLFLLFSPVPVFEEQNEAIGGFALRATTWSSLAYVDMPALLTLPLICHWATSHMVMILPKYNTRFP